MDIKTLCLAVLARGESTGYEIKKQLEEGPLAHFYRAGFSSIYPALGKLDAAGLVTCTETPRVGRPGKKVYRITTEGLAAFRRRLAKTPAMDKVRSEHLFMMFFAEFLDPEKRRQVLESYIAEYRGAVAQLMEIDLAGAEPSRRFVHAFGMSLYRHGIDFMENNRDLLLDEQTAEALAASPRKAAGAEQ